MKILFTFFFFLLSLSLSFATLDDAELYYSLDNDDLSGSNPLDISGNGNDGTTTGATTGVTGILKEAFDFESSLNTNRISAGSQSYTGDMTIITWIKAESTTGIQAIISNYNSAGNGAQYHLRISSGLIQFCTNNAGFEACESSATTVTAGSWYHICAPISSNIIQFYVNGVASGSSQTIGTRGTPGSMSVGRAGDYNGLYFDGVIDEVAMYSNAKSSTECADSYNAGIGFNPYGAPPVSDNFSVEFRDKYSGNLINNVTFYNATSTLTNTTGSFIQTDILPNQIISFTGSAQGYSNTTVTGWNSSNQYLINLTPKPLEDFVLLTPNNSVLTDGLYNLSWTEAVSPSSKTVTYTTTINYVGNGSQVYTNSTTNLYQEIDLSNFNSENYSVSINASEQFTNLSFVQNSNFVVNRTNTLTFFNEQTSTAIEGANITIDLPNSNLNLELVTNASGQVSFGSYYDGKLQDGTYNITFEDFIGFETPITFTRERNLLPFQDAFNITVISININLFFRNNNEVFTKKANINIEGLTNFSTSNGSAFIQNATISQGKYRITVSSEGYFNEEKEFSFNGQQAVNVNLYLLETNNSNSGTVTIRAVDELSRLLQNAQVNLLEYDTSTLSYIEVSECFTDSNGQCKFIVETNSKSYQFTASRQINDQLVTASTNPQIFEDDIVGGETVVFSEEIITLTLSSLQQFTINPIQNIIYSVDENLDDATNQSTISVSFNTIDGTALTVCVEYFELVGGIENSLTGDTFCVTGSSAEVTENAFFTLNRSKSYVAKVYIKNGDGQIPLDLFRYLSTDSFAERLEANATLPFFILFLWIGLISITLMFKNVPLTGVSIIAGTWILFFFFPNITIGSASALQTILGLNLIYIGRKKEDFN